MAVLQQVQVAVPGSPADHQASAAATPLLVVGDQEANNHPGDGQARTASRGTPWIVILGFLYLSLNAAMAIYRSQGDAMAIAFVGFSYGDLVVLFACLRMYERAAAGSPARQRLKVAVWLLTTLLTLAFSYKVAAVVPAPVAILVWLVSFATVAGGFFAFFLYNKKRN